MESGKQFWLLRLAIALVVCVWPGMSQAYAKATAAIEGHWIGWIKLGIQETITFDLYNSPCLWGQPDETPYLTQQADGRVDVVSTATLPGGTVIISLFPLIRSGATYQLEVGTWSGVSITGIIVDAEGKNAGTFSFAKSSDSSLLKRELIGLVGRPGQSCYGTGPQAPPVTACRQA